MWRSPFSKGQYPSAWQVNIPRLALQLKLEAQMANQEMRTEDTTGVVYWEGSVKVKGNRSGQAIDGEGYAELTGYATPFKAPL
jgi:predicted secreted hydrolase